MATYGDTDFYISLSSAIGTGSGGIHDGEAIPSGDIVYLFSDKLGGNDKFMQKIKNLAMGTNYSNKNGKYKPSVRLDTCIIIKQTQADNTAEFNAQVTQIRKWHKAASNPIYLTIFSETDERNIALGVNPSTGAPIDYLKGYVTDFGWDVKGNIYYIKGLSFTACDY